MSDLFDVLQIESRELESYFKKASIEGRGTPQEVAERREVAFQNFLRRYTSPLSTVTKGNILGAQNERSASIDCIVLNPAHPYFAADQSGGSIILAEGVDLAVEVKPDISDQKELVRGLRQGVSVKKIWRNRVGIFNLVGESRGIIENYHHRIPYGIYSETCSRDLASILERVVSYYEEESVSREYQFDFIVVNGRCLILNVAPDSYVSNAETQQRGILILETPDSLAAFLALILSFPKSEPSIGPHVLGHYLKWQWHNGYFVAELDERLRSIK